MRLKLGKVHQQFSIRADIPLPPYHFFSEHWWHGDVVPSSQRRENAGSPVDGVWIPSAHEAMFVAELGSSQ